MISSIFLLTLSLAQFSFASYGYGNYSFPASTSTTIVTSYFTNTRTYAPPSSMVTAPPSSAASTTTINETITEVVTRTCGGRVINAPNAEVVYWDSDVYGYVVSLGSCILSASTTDSQGILILLVLRTCYN